MTRGLVWIPSKSSNFVEILDSLVDNWLVELPYEFQAEYSLENCRDLRATSMSTSSASSTFNLTASDSLTFERETTEVPYWKIVDPTLEQKVRWEEEAKLMFRTEANLGGEHVAFWKVSDRNLAKEVLWSNALSGSAGLVSCMLSGDCDPLMLQDVASEVQNKRGSVQGGLLFDDAWERIAESCRLGVWFGQPDWDFSGSVLLTSADPEVLKKVLLLAVGAGAKEVANFQAALALWRIDREGNCVCMVNIESELAR